MNIAYENKIVNMDSVTNVVVEENKLIFNLDYSVSLDSNPDKIIADYVYMNFINISEYNDILEKIGTLGWLDSEFGNYDFNDNYRANNRIVNPKMISFVKFEERKQRIILNLRTSVSRNKNVHEKTSAFVFFDHIKKDDYLDEVDRITKILVGDNE